MSWTAAMIGNVKMGDCCVGVNSGNVDWGVTVANQKSYLSLDGLEDYTKRMKEMIDKKLEVINERLKKLEDGGFDGKFGTVRGWMS